MNERDKTLYELANAEMRLSRADAKVDDYGLFPPTWEQVCLYLSDLCLECTDAEEYTGYQVEDWHWNPEKGLFLKVRTTPRVGKKRYGKWHWIPVMDLIDKLPSTFLPQERTKFEAALEIYSTYSTLCREQYKAQEP